MDESLVLKRTRSQFRLLLAAKEQREGVTIKLKPLAKHLDISPYTLYAFANDTLDHFPRDMIDTLCAYLDCEPGDLFKREEHAPEDRKRPQRASTAWATETVNQLFHAYQHDPAALVLACEDLLQTTDAEQGAAVQRALQERREAQYRWLAAGIGMGTMLAGVEFADLLFCRSSAGTTVVFTRVTVQLGG